MPIPKFPAIDVTYQVSNEKITAKVIVRNGKILDAAPVIRVFIGQYLDNLVSWMRKMGPTEVTMLHSEEDTAKKRNPYV